MQTKNRSFGRRTELASQEPAPPKPQLREVPEVDPRNEVRRRVLQSGKICYGEQLALTLDCIVHDVSGTGMRVQLATGGRRGMSAQEDAGANLPSEVVIVYFRQNIAYRASVAWKRRSSIGLKFISKIDLTNSDTSETKFLRLLCAEHQLRTSGIALSE